MAAKDVEAIVTELCARIADAAAIVVYDIVFRRSGPRWKLQIFLDRVEGGVTLADCESFSRQLSRELDLLDPIPHGYDLEVSSPGIERALRTPQHWALAQGRSVQVRFRGADGAARTIIANVKQSDGHNALVVDAQGAEHTVPLDAVLAAKLHVDW